MESLAAAFADSVEAASSLSGTPAETVHIVGGGAQNRLLCQSVADRVGVPVLAGPVEATALGNVLIQARTHGLLTGDLESLRANVTGSALVARYTPRHSSGTKPTPRARTLTGRKGLTMKRQFPKAADLAPLMQFKKPQLNAKTRRLEKALTIEDLRRIAKRRTPKAAFDYTDGSAEAELSIARARQAFSDIEFQPAILRDVSTVNTGWQVLGAPVAQPFGIAPTGFTRMMQTEGEIAGARAAGRAGIPFSLSTMGTTSIEDVAAANPHGRNWFQLYMWKDRDRSMALVERAAAAGYDTLLVTVDVPGGRGTPARQAQRHVDPARADPGHRSPTRCPARNGGSTS